VTGRRLRIAMVGQRGVPATFGGVERHVEELGSRLAERGHEVTVYGRTNYVRERRTEYRGMHVRNLPTVNSKHLDAIVHSGISTLDAMFRGTDVVHYHAIGPGLPSFLPRYLSSARVVQTVHGRDAERAKWGPAARIVLRTAEWMSAHVPDATIVVARNLAEHYGRSYRRRTWVIPNGVEPGEQRPAVAITDRWDLSRGSYALFVGRLVPEKAPDLLVRAWQDIGGDRKLVIAGGSSFTDDYVRSLERLAAQDDRVVLAGYVFGTALEELYANAAAFVLPSALEGLPLTLLEAAAYGTPIVASDIPPHLEVLDDDAPGHRLFSAGSETSLIEALGRSFRDPDAETEGAVKLRDRVLETYRWDTVVDETERLYRHVLGIR
jgi:glycosyltransferase involved in cell wall biosynthesis